ncbi:COMM domain-containing protein 8 isoform X1 [Neophocaena asiaeorientalis asiaeorientalis]|uniref:COMM domain-containing protein 8 isoform X1 n=2 Tax=Neophocaena asiaeorientalis asiaeorientalis TaxID=1706337 RepID=A0A341ABW6_NEOAA|nr:COMM domain-containing protein 8 isoform X1 [Neophocaena asiaeorientalis asiaeorientalis]
MEPEEGVPLWRLQKLPAELGLQLLHKIIDGICGRTYPLYQDYHSVWDSTEWMHVLEDITNFFKAVVGKNLSDEEISQQLDQLNSSHQEAIMKCLKSRKDEIKQALLEEIVDISSSQLQDFDWQLKLALSSDKIATLQMPLLNLHLDVKENGEVKPYSVEMSKEELQNLINSLEAANKVPPEDPPDQRQILDGLTYEGAPGISLHRDLRWGETASGWTAAYTWMFKGISFFKWPEQNF